VTLLGLWCSGQRVAFGASVQEDFASMHGLNSLSSSLHEWLDSFGGQAKNMWIVRQKAAQVRLTVSCFPLRGYITTSMSGFHRSLQVHKSQLFLLIHVMSVVANDVPRYV
jgi:hypothetical protein